LGGRGKAAFPWTRKRILETADRAVDERGQVPKKLACPGVLRLAFAFGVLCSGRGPSWQVVSGQGLPEVTTEGVMCLGRSREEGLLSLLALSSGGMQRILNASPEFPLDRVKVHSVWSERLTADGGSVAKVSLVLHDYCFFCTVNQAAISGVMPCYVAVRSKHLPQPSSEPHIDCKDSAARGGRGGKRDVRGWSTPSRRQRRNHKGLAYWSSITGGPAEYDKHIKHEPCVAFGKIPAPMLPETDLPAARLDLGMRQQRRNRWRRTPLATWGPTVCAGNAPGRATVATCLRRPHATYNEDPCVLSQNPWRVGYRTEKSSRIGLLFSARATSSLDAWGFIVVSITARGGAPLAPALHPPPSTGPTSAAPASEECDMAVQPRGCLIHALNGFLGRPVASSSCLLAYERPRMKRATRWFIRYQTKTPRCVCCDHFKIHSKEVGRWGGASKPPTGPQVSARPSPCPVPSESRNSRELPIQAGF